MSGSGPAHPDDIRQLERILACTQAMKVMNTNLQAISLQVKGALYTVNTTDQLMDTWLALWLRARDRQQDISLLTEDFRPPSLVETKNQLAQSSSSASEHDGVYEDGEQDEFDPFATQPRGPRTRRSIVSRLTAPTQSSQRKSLANVVGGSSRPITAGGGGVVAVGDLAEEYGIGGANRGRRSTSTAPAQQRRVSTALVTPAPRKTSTIATRGGGGSGGGGATVTMTTGKRSASTAAVDATGDGRRKSLRR